MKHLYRRQKQQYILGGLVGIVGVVSVLSLLILYLPVRAENFRLQSDSERFERESIERTETLKRLETAEIELDDARRERLRFLAARLIPRDQGFAALLPDLERLAEMAGIQRNQVLYAADPVPQFGIYSVRISLPVRGPYTAVTRFIREIESADTVFILDSIGLNRADPDGQDDLDLSLNLTTFFSYES